jgi:uncharacterized protein YbaR (Trm112 family)/SAM-dependent methyltransferase
LLDFLACPECGCVQLSLDTFSSREEEVIDGVLTCGGCRRRYPIIGGVPRLLPDALIGTLSRYHPNFFSRYDVALRGSAERGEVARTLTFYSYARAKLFVSEPEPELIAYWRQSLEYRLPGIHDLAGQIGLDAGCGEGRYTYCLAESGAEVIGMDLSEAVNLAYRRNRSNPWAHIVQGSIYQPPFTQQVFDFVFSTGVLHHLPDPEAGFQALVPLLRAGGSFHIWVYGLRQMSIVYRLSHLTFLREMGSRLPPQVSYLLSVPLGLALHASVFQPIRLVMRAGEGASGRAGDRVTSLRERIPLQLRELASLPLRMHIAEVQDRIGVPITNYLTADEVLAWYERAGFRGITVNPTQGGRGWSGRGYL